jgi:2'-5' RNA ligase
MRLFVALEIPQEVRESLAGLLQSLRAISPQTKWARPENLHLTLKFIGEVPEAKLASIRAALAAVKCDVPVRLEVRGLGFFPNARHPRVFWAGIESSSNLKTLSESISLALEKIGIAREERDFSPHLTLARFESPRLEDKLRAAIEERSSVGFGEVFATQFHLIESKLKSSSAEYTTVESFWFVTAEA